MLEFTAEVDDELQIEPGWEGTSRVEKALRERTERDLLAALLGPHRQSLEQYILVVIIGQAAGGLSYDEVVGYFPEIAQDSPDRAALAPAIASLPADEQQILKDMGEEGVLGESIEDIYNATRVELRRITLEE